jgi:iron complex outermembrane recepter protein
MPGSCFIQRVIKWLGVIFAIAILTTTAAARAGDQIQDFHIQSQPLSQALLRYSRQTGVIIVASSDLISGKVSTPIKGAYTPQKALNILVKGTGLEARTASTGGLVLVKAPLIDRSDKPANEVRRDDGKPAEVIVTGTRSVSVRAADSAMPIQLIDTAALTWGGQADLAQALVQNAPSFQVQAFGRDAANNTPSGRLRGLSPNNTLVLINGKRRHGTSSLSVIAGPYQGGSSVDFSLVPIGAVDRIEVLTDGAAAQYGTDAISGVINIILKKDGHGTTITTTAGQYIDGGGETADLTVNTGFKPTERSFVNLTLDIKYHGYSNRGAVDPRVRHYDGLAALPDYPYLNRVFGDGTYHLAIGSFNAGLDLNDQWQIYAFGTHSAKTASSYENWRTPDRMPGLYPFGFSPHEAIREKDTAISLGLRGQWKGWQIDAGTSYGGDRQDIYNYGGGNVSLFRDTGATPSLFYVGAFATTQWAQTLDVSRAFDIAAGLNVAYGFEYRQETYELKTGDHASTYKEGSQGFPGFSATDAGQYDRDNVAAYIDLALRPMPDLSVETAARYEHYSDFGDTFIGKLTTRYDITPALAVRGTISNGFRAPTMPEEYYSATNVTPTSAMVQLPPNSAAARLLGIEPLKPEISTNYSLGIVIRPRRNVVVALDTYQIDIDGRIVGSGAIYGSGSPDGTNSAAVGAALTAAGVDLDPEMTRTGINIFSNGVNTTTRGIEFAMSYPETYGIGKVIWSLSANYSLTRVRDILQTPAQIQPQALFDLNAISNLEDSSPSYRWIAAAGWSGGKWTANLRTTLHGHSSSMIQSDAYSEDGVHHPAEWFKSTVRPHIITDLEVGYQLYTSIRLVAGANNLFNIYPEKLREDLLHSYVATDSFQAVYQYASWSPFGINGGYYYAKIAVRF